MKKSLPILMAIVAGIFFFFIGRLVGDWYADVLKGSGGMVTATEMIQCKYVIPIVLAGIAAWIAYYFVKEK